MTISKKGTGSIKIKETGDSIIKIPKNIIKYAKKTNPLEENEDGSSIMTHEGGIHGEIEYKNF